MRRIARPGMCRSTTKPCACCGTGANRPELGRVSLDVVGFQTAWETVLKRARISNFRWHDLRHHFASRLVQNGVPLNTVRDLLGHGSVGTSLRYAHLAPISGAKPSPSSTKSQFLHSPCACSGKAFPQKTVIGLLEWSQGLGCILTCAYKRSRKCLVFQVKNENRAILTLTLRLRRPGRLGARR